MNGPLRNARYQHERGAALLTVLVASACVSVLIALGYTIIRQGILSTRKDLSVRGQATSIALSGVTESLSWFRSRPQQPVRRFNPTGDKGELGLVRTFPISDASKLFGRYQVDATDAEDISDLRGRGRKGDGLVWQVKSHGSVYIQRDAGLPYDRSPNEVVAEVTMSAEFQRLNVSPPAASAILAETGQSIEILEGGRVRGLAGAALTYRHGTGRPSVSVPFEVTSGSSSRYNPAPEKNYDLELRRIFGVNGRELRELADIVVASLDALPADMPRMAIVVVDGDARFTRSRPLNGGGILMVDGDLEIAANSNSTFSGLIYCKGRAVIDAPSLITGSLIAVGGVRLQGFGDFAEIQYGQEVLNVIRQRLGQYRQTQAAIRVSS